MNGLTLEGCAPTPLAAYLKALGVLRLIGEQCPDWEVRGAWNGERFVLESPRFDGSDGASLLESFFLECYRPTPLVSPWNGGSGFYPGDNRTGIDALAASGAERFRDYRESIDFCRAAVARFRLDESPKAEAKAAFLTHVRAEAPDRLLDWMDAAILLAGEEPRYPPLLGTGGNDGRLDFTNNFMQRLTELFDAEGAPAAGAGPWLRSALFAEPVPGLVSVAIGQFHPGGAGGPNAAAGFDADSQVNPWDFVLMLEGALVFAAAATRRLESAEPGALAYPFTVRPTAVGSGGMGRADESQARAESWMPLWGRPATAGEIAALLSEGRATLGRRPARDGLGFARAVARLGVDRGIREFQRFGFLMRSGKAYLALPLSRLAVRHNRHAELIDDLEQFRFLDTVRQFGRKEEAPARVQSRVRQLEEALFALAGERGAEAGHRAVQNVLIQLGALMAAVSGSPKAREAVPPLPRTLPRAWVDRADDGSHEFRCAAALAGINCDGPLAMRRFRFPVEFDARARRWIWAPESHLAVWGNGSLSANLARVVGRMRIESMAAGVGTKPFSARAGASTADVAALLDSTLDESRVAGLLAGLVHVWIPPEFERRGRSVPMPGAYSVLKPYFVPEARLADYLHVDSEDFGEARKERLPLPGALLAKLGASQVDDALQLAWRNLRTAGFQLPPKPARPPAACGIDGDRLLAALAIPIGQDALNSCLHPLLHIKELTETAQGECP